MILGYPSSADKDSVFQNMKLCPMVTSYLSTLAPDPRRFVSSM